MENKTRSPIEHFQDSLKMTYEDLAEYAFSQDGVIRERYFIQEHLDGVVESPLDTGPDGYDFRRRKEVEIKSPCFSKKIYKGNSVSNLMNLKMTYGNITEDSYNYKISSNEDVYISQYHKMELLLVVRFDFRDISHLYRNAIDRGAKSLTITWSHIKNINSLEFFFINEKISDFEEYFVKDLYSWITGSQSNKNVNSIENKLKLVYGSDVSFSKDSKNKKVMIYSPEQRSLSYSTLNKYYQKKLNEL